MATPLKKVLLFCAMAAIAADPSSAADSLLVNPTHAVSHENSDGFIFTVGAGPGIESDYLHSNSTVAALPINGLHDESPNFALSSRIGLGASFFGFSLLGENHCNFFAMGHDWFLTMINGIGTDIGIIQKINKSLGMSVGIGASTWKASYDNEYVEGFGAFASIRYSPLKLLSLSLDADFGVPTSTGSAGTADIKNYYQYLNVGLKANIQKMP
jgi:opacity protein-like surface antigen